MEVIRGITAVIEVAVIRGEDGISPLAYILSAVLRSHWILPAKRALSEIISERVVLRNQYLATK